MHARLQAHDCSKQEQLELRDWENQDEDRASASATARRVLTGVDRLAAHEDFGRKLRALTEQALKSESSGRGRSPAISRLPQRWRWGAGLAAALAVVVVSWQLQTGRPAQQVQASVYETAAHERRVVTLDDGSVIQLDVATRIAVKMSRERREIELLDGRALFAVAHDSSRPFSVSANGSRTTALGTRFQVETGVNRVVVTLAEGSVAVDGAAGGSAKSWQERLAPGEQLDIDSSTAMRTRHMVDPQLVTSWTQGRHVFRGTPLRQALDEVNRYASHKVVLGDPSLADLPVAGTFVAGDSEVVVSAFAAVLPLRIVEGSDHEIILFRRYSR